MNVEIYSTDDYAGLDCGNLRFYYGYETADPETEEWCFQVTKSGKIISRMCQSEIEDSTKSKLRDVNDYLMAGIGIWIVKDKIDCGISLG